MGDDIRTRIEGLVGGKKVMLFMKGTKQFPACGFSNAVVQILKKEGVEFDTFNILADAEVRQGLKEYSSWPTFPQLYVKGEFVGGCDIVKTMYASGDLQRLLGVEEKEVRAPGVTISAAAAAAFKDAASDAAGDVLRLEIDPQFNVDLHFGPKAAGDVDVTSNGVVLHVDRASIGRADGITIDFVEGPKGMGFKIENPNEPPRVKPIAPKALKALLDLGRVELFDVRPDDERAKASIAKARKLDPAGHEYLLGLKRDTAIALHCHHGMRSAAAAEQLLREGFTNVYNLDGGIEAWSSDVDPSVPHY